MCLMRCLTPGCHISGDGRRICCEEMLLLPKEADRSGLSQGYQQKRPKPNSLICINVPVAFFGRSGNGSEGGRCFLKGFWGQTHLSPQPLRAWMLLQQNQKS